VTWLVTASYRASWQNTAAKPWVCASAAGISAVVCRNVLTIDPSDTIPPSTTEIDPIDAT
jgi:hypothetical protein